MWDPVGEDSARPRAGRIRIRILTTLDLPIDGDRHRRVLAVPAFLRT